MRTASDLQTPASRPVSRATGCAAAFSLLYVLNASAFAQSCAPATPRIDSGTGFTPFGANEQALARGGNRGRAWEWAIGTDTDAGQKVQGSLDWVSGKVYRWKVINSGSGNEVLEIREGQRLRLRLVYPAGMDAGNALELRVSTSPGIGPNTSIEASLKRLNGYRVSGSLSQAGTRGRSAQAQYFYYPQMEQGFTAEGTVRLTFARKPPTGARVEFAVRAGTIPCSSTGNPPTVSITSPSADSVFIAPANINVTANAEDSDGTVTQVAFYANGNPIGVATSNPFTIQWANALAGAYSLTAVVTDNDGVQSTSAAVPITIGAEKALYFIHVDHLNTPRLIANATQQTVWRRDNQEPFGDSPPGENPSGLGAFEFPLRDEGTYADKETNVVYNVNRYRDLSGGRFVQADPLGLAGGDLSLYVLNKNNPLTYTDPLGLATYMCTRRLNWVPLQVGPLFHQYICVGNAQGGYTCGGLEPSTSNVFDTPGIIERDKMKPQSCQVVQNDNDCVEQCIKDTFRQPPPNYSVDLSRGENCQTYANAAVIDCVARCRTKKK